VVARESRERKRENICFVGREESERRKVCGFGVEAPGRGVKQQLFVTYKERAVGLVVW